MTQMNQQPASQPITQLNASNSDSDGWPSVLDNATVLSGGGSGASGGSSGSSSRQLQQQRRNATAINTADDSSRTSSCSSPPRPGQQQHRLGVDDGKSPSRLPPRQTIASAHYSNTSSGAASACQHHLHVSSEDLALIAASFSMFGRPALATDLLRPPSNTSDWNGRRASSV
jgi:hypothetical protein